MRIMHCCLAAFYIDNYGYQENILPKAHKNQGHDVFIVASTENYLADKTLGYSKAESYINEHGIPVCRLPYASWIPKVIVRKLRLYRGLKVKLEEFKPDVIFLHDIQFLDVLTIIDFVKKHPNTKIFSDCHTDFINSGKNWVSKNILHKVIYKWCAKRIEPYVEMFFGVTPLRSKFLEDVYGIDKKKIDLLVMGYDDTKPLKASQTEIRNNIRTKLGIADNDFLIVTGGKIDERKKIHNLIEAFCELQLKNTKLLVFGTPTPDMKILIEDLSKKTNVVFVGWSSQQDICNYLLSSDVAFFPGTHSVLWEQTVGLGVPSVFKKWDGMTHVDVGGNCILLDKGDNEEIKATLMSLVSNKELLNRMLAVATTKGKLVFSYNEIAKKAIGLN
ncbi:glycosyltransferase family 4 protein [Colwellia sp. MB02u-10]|uniref:glycosyltransferase family 4 protein n=1 Tax=Colwellia sp. MB02u-10 TaxID=2759828 RepID=UPI0015F3883B|nr:glycosyltransferase family 4 protein [Colwellia sp. MB02u-10]MBA6342122.1 glycosyltransferase family 4 protein [Colwellia sp. MB02u-10]